MTIENQAAAPLSEKEGEELFLKAFSEIHSTEYKPSEFKDSPPVEDTPPAQDTPAQETQEEVAPAPTEPENKEETQPEEPAKSSPQQPATYEQLIEQFPEDKRDLVKQLVLAQQRVEQQHRSAQGRLAAERKQRHQLERELSQLRSRTGASSPQDPALAEQAKADYEKSIGEWKQVVEAEPTLAKAVDALTDAKVRSAVEGLRSELDGRDEVYQRQAYEDEKQREMNLLLEVVPNALEVARSPEFMFWKENVAPPGIRQLAETSINHLDALSVFQQYAPWATQLNEHRTAQGATQAQPTTPAAPTVADTISKTRQEKVSPVVQGNPAKPQTAPALGNEFSDEEGQKLFEEAFRKIINNR